MRASATAVLAACLLGPAVAAEETDAPDGDFLEYLGALVMLEGEWLHPDDLEDDPEDEVQYEDETAGDEPGEAPGATRAVATEEGQ